MIEKCQVFTPVQYVNELLDAVGYVNDLHCKKVIENACGDGNILKEIVKRYIVDSLRNKKSRKEIKLGLERYIYGAEIDYDHYTNCLNNLDEVASFFGINSVKWNIINSDFLKHNCKNEFDYVIGNPPYINYRDLEKETRDYLKDRFSSCRHGKFDYCYAFIEASLLCLNPTGKLAYLIPSSIFKNVFAQNLRDLILPSTTRIIDFTSRRIFGQATTASAILVCNKAVVSETVDYFDVVNNTSFKISRRNLSNKWVFSEARPRNIKKRRFGDYYSASISIATLLNEAFVLKDSKVEGDYIITKNFKIERDLIRKAVSPRSLNCKKTELILFPYTYIEKKLVRYKRDEFEGTFQQATMYLRSFEKKLRNRNSDKSVEWFEYGRTQALAHLNQPKLLLSTIVTKEVKVYELSKDVIPYSGIYIVALGQSSLERAKDILESRSFYQFVKGIGTNASGNSLRITVADINNYEY